ncbi:NDR1/HIN1-like protein 3 [Ananas comosus]|uniref:NDR1/HIN1-like protein 3 n=1 Tax=Ananas comosus TaxID=4615 RepID=A0A6P5GU32_ANACO|nr:NDR1/HIN1-like protein 3 [Ananas comosus]
MSNPSGADGCTRCCSKFCGLLFFAGFLVFDFWLIFRPRRIGASVDSASLTEFALSPSGALLFNLTADLSLRNPNSRIGVYYDRLDAAAFYSGALLGPADSPFPEFYQHPKTTTAVSAVFKGRTAGVGAGVSDAFGREKGEGAFRVEITVHAKLRYKVWFAKVHGFKPKVDCVVKLLPPPPTAVSSAAAFAPTKCSVDY